ncbi:MAG: HAD family phosphatase [Actinomycetota bacterium]
MEAAIFDFGGVLTTPIRLSFEQFEDALSLPEGSLLAAFIHRPDDGEPDFALLEKGQISEGEFYRRMMNKLREHTGVDIELPEEPAVIRRRLFGGIRANDQMLTAAAAIGRYYKTAILTNNVKEWTDWREMVNAHIFDLVVDSSAEGMRKPDPEIYRLTCARLAIEPHRAAFVDDIPDNVHGAAAVGIHAIQFTTTDEVLAQLRALFPRAFTPGEEPVHA